MFLPKYNKYEDSYSSKNAKEARSVFFTHLTTYISINISTWGNGNWVFVSILWGLLLIAHYKSIKQAFSRAQEEFLETSTLEYIDDITPLPPAPNLALVKND